MIYGAALIPSSRTNSKRGAFSLVELSIVLVILGLLTGGILTGQSLIRAAELRSITTDFNNYQTALMTFRDKYFAVPGDMNNAEAFWGQEDPVAATCRAAASATQATCNGDGDGLVELLASTGASFEVYRAWQHLANAGLINGQFQGNPGSAGSWDSDPGRNIPASKVSNGGYNLLSITTGTYAALLKLPNANYLSLGLDTGGNSASVSAFISAEEMWNLDQKIDDGLPGQGTLVSFNNSSRPNCVTSDDAATAAYDLDNTRSDACTLFFLGL